MTQCVILSECKIKELDSYNEEGQNKLPSCQGFIFNVNFKIGWHFILGIGLINDEQSSHSSELSRVIGSNSLSHHLGIFASWPAEIEE